MAYKPWDPVEMGSMDEDTWRRTVVGKVNEIRSEISSNTDATLTGNEAIEVVRRDVGALSTKVKPLTDAWEKAQKGFEVVGWIGTGFEWLLKKWFLVVAIAIAAKILLSGGTWTEVIKLFKDLPP